MSEQSLIPLRDWKARRLHFPITITCLVKHGKLGYIQPRPIKIGKTPTTFHEQRSLSERLYRAQGIDTKILLGHKTQSTTDRYNDDRGKEWTKLAI